MSAPSQAGAVAVVIPNVVGVEIAWANPPSAGRPPIGTKLYAAPPAAVPVADLEGLVAGWLTDAEYLEADGERSRANDLRQRADELTTIIKERSNGR